MERGKLHVRDARKLIVHLLLLGSQLLFVGQVLPFAAAAYAEMLARGLNAHVAILHETHHLGLAIAVFFLSYFEVYHVAWHYEGYENNHVVDPRQRLSFRRHVCNGDVLQYRKLFSLSCHIYNKVQRTRAVREETGLLSALFFTKVHRTQRRRCARTCATHLQRYIFPSKYPNILLAVYDNRHFCHVQFTKSELKVL